jgi:uncharacterized protein (DUF3820 family)
MSWPKQNKYFGKNRRAKRRKNFPKGQHGPIMDGTQTIQANAARNIWIEKTT